MNSIDAKKYYLDFVGFMSMGILSIGYIMFVRLFAEINIQFSFLNFPVFLGEILLALCGIVYLMSGKIHFKELKRTHIIIIAYFVFVVLKAMYGYSQWGPLAFRNAALLYYPAFIIFGYSFYRSEFFSSSNSRVYLFIILLLMATRKFSDYWTLSYCSLAVILIYRQNNKTFKYLMLAILLVAIPYKWIFYNSRMMMIAHSIVMVFLAAVFYCISNIKKAQKITILIVGFLVIAGGIMKYSDKNSLISILKVDKIVGSFNYYDAKAKEALETQGSMIRDRINFIYDSNMEKEETLFREVKNKQGGDLFKSRQEFYEDKIRVYNPDSGSIIKKEETRTVFFQEKNELKTLIKNKNKEIAPERTFSDGDLFKSRQEFYKDKSRVYNPDSGSITVFSKGKLVEVKIYNPEFLSMHQRNQTFFDGMIGGKVESEENVEPRNLNVAYTNAVFRLFIWRDIIVEFIQKKPVFGFDFGKPIRPKSLIALDWSYIELKNDGWIGVHNSYLHMIYRTGIVGVVFIITILTLLFRSIHTFIRHRSITGILLSTIIINWFVAANFLLIFELPYTAVPIWCLFGLMLAYKNNLVLQKTKSV